MPSQRICPICGKHFQSASDLTSGQSTSEKSNEPFCSARCAWADLGRWLDGKYQVPVDEPAALESFASDAESPDDARR